jgi:hypothetical protein
VPKSTGTILRKIQDTIVADMSSFSTSKCHETVEVYEGTLQNEHHVEFLILTAVVSNIAVFWDTSFSYNTLISCSSDFRH